jgi:hypothetical protein
MEVHELTRHYQSKSNEELLLLALDAPQLSSEARTALFGELARRRINADEQLETFRQEEERNKAEPRRASGSPFFRDWPGIGKFIAEVLHIYHSQLWLFFKLTFPAVVCGAVVTLIVRLEVFDIAQHISPGPEALRYRSEIIEIWSVSLVGYLLTWTAFCFSFGAICSAVLGIVSGEVPSIREAFATVGERLNSVVRLALLLFVLQVAAIAVAMAIPDLLFLVYAHLRGFPIQLLFIASTGFAVLLISRFALAVPAVVLDNYGVAQAMFRSDELTEGKWLTLAALLTKSLAGGYVAAFLPFWLAARVAESTPLPSWLPWVLNAASIIGVTLVEPTMFIGFALLYASAPSLPSTENAAHVLRES